MEQLLDIVIFKGIIECCVSVCVQDCVEQMMPLHIAVPLSFVVCLL